MITPDSGYEIKNVLVDGVSKGKITSYTFENVTENHTIQAEFRRSLIPEGPDNGNNNGNQNQNPSPEPNQNPAPNPGQNPDSGLTPGQNQEPNQNPGSNQQPAGNPQTEPAQQTAENPQQTDKGTAAAATADTTADTATNNRTKTGDDTFVEFYATMAMIAGFTCIMLYFAEQGKGMSEEEKKRKVAAWIAWAKQGKGLRRAIALSAIFFLLLYYHSIGKHLSKEYKTIITG